MALANFQSREFTKTTETKWVVKVFRIYFSARKQETVMENKQVHSLCSGTKRGKKKKERKEKKRKRVHVLR